AVFADRRARFALFLAGRIEDHQQAAVDRRFQQPLGDRHLEAQAGALSLLLDRIVGRGPAGAQHQQTGQPDEQGTEARHGRSLWRPTPGPDPDMASAPVMIVSPPTDASACALADGACGVATPLWLFGVRCAAPLWLVWLVWLLWPLWLVWLFRRRQTANLSK